MGRKRKAARGFQWVREDVEGEAIESPYRLSHREIQSEDSDVEDLVEELIALSPDRRELLDTDREFKDALEEVNRLEGSARARMKRRIKRLARAHELEDLRQALIDETPEEVRLRGLERWRERILGEGDDAIQEFIDAHDGVDRQELRNLARIASRTDDAGQRANRKLFQLLKSSTATEAPI